MGRAGVDLIRADNDIRDAIAVDVSFIDPDSGSPFDWASRVVLEMPTLGVQEMGRS